MSFVFPRFPKTATSRPLHIAALTVVLVIAIGVLVAHVVSGGHDCMAGPGKTCAIVPPAGFMSIALGALALVVEPRRVTAPGAPSLRALEVLQLR
jgi:hypothetical protein